MKFDEELSLIEAILFLEPEGIDRHRLEKISNFPSPLVDSVLKQLQEKYAKSDSGLELKIEEHLYSLAPKQNLWPHLKDHYGRKQDEKMSKAALETLSIIAYSQPLTRPEVESIRGVACAPVIKVLLEKNLIREVGRKEGPGRPVQYGTTKEFLQLFGLKSIADLPRLEETEREKFELDAGI